MQVVMDVISYIVDLGSYIFVPMLMCLIGLLFGLKFPKALRAGATVGVGLVGVSIVSTLTSQSLGPVINEMVKVLNLNLTAIDVGGSPAAAVGFGGLLGRAPDYDDWELNGDLLFWNEPLQCSYELSSIGIRVSPESMDRQLTAAGCDDRRELPFHKAVLNGELPYTIGGGIGQSRLCMLLLGSAHIGEVQASVWDNATREACEKAGIPLL